jgi:hypothetical protein
MKGILAVHGDQNWVIIHSASEKVIAVFNDRHE